MDPEMEYQVE